MSKQKEVVRGTLELNMVAVNIELFKPFHDFIEEYLAFFGSRQTLEQFCMVAVYDKVCHLYQELQGFVSNKSNQIDPQAWFEKWPHISVATIEEEAEEDC